MRDVEGFQFHENSREELLPGFDAGFPYIATRARLEQYADPIVPWHWHRAVELSYLQSGSLEYTTPRGTRVFHAGSGGMVNAGVLHASRPLPARERCVQLLHLFDPSLIGGERGSRIEQKYVLPLTASSGMALLALSPDCPEQASILQKIQAAFSLPKRDWGYEIRLRERLADVWLALAALARPDIGGARRQSDDDGRVKTMMSFIHEHYKEPISISQLASAAHVSERGCFRLFQETLRASPLSYIRDYRLQAARGLLTRTDESVTEIACRCGFGTSSYFGRIFRERFGCSPIAWRRQRATMSKEGEGESAWN